MSTNTEQGSSDQADSTPAQPEENLATTALNPNFSALEFDIDHGSEVDGAVRLLEAEWLAVYSAA